MSYSLRLVTGPGVEPVTAAELAAHARATGASDQALIANYVTPAREAIERACRVAMINQNWEYWLDRLPDPEPAGRIIELPIGPLSSVTSVTVYDPFDAPTLIQPSAYLVDTASDPGRLILRPDAGIPLTLRFVQVVKVLFVAGYGAAAAAVPAELTLAVKALGAWYFEHGYGGGIPDELWPAIMPFRRVTVA